MSSASIRKWVGAGLVSVGGLLLAPQVLTWLFPASGMFAEEIQTTTNTDTTDAAGPVMETVVVHTFISPLIPLVFLVVGLLLILGQGKGRREIKPPAS